MKTVYELKRDFDELQTSPVRLGVIFGLLIILFHYTVIDDLSLKLTKGIFDSSLLNTILIFSVLTAFVIGSLRKFLLLSDDIINFSKEIIKLSYDVFSVALGCVFVICAWFFILFIMRDVDLQSFLGMVGAILTILAVGHILFWLFCFINKEFRVFSLKKLDKSIYKMLLYLSLASVLNNYQAFLN